MTCCAVTIYNTVSQMESEKNITFIVVGTDPENTAHLSAVCAFHYCEITALDVKGLTCTGRTEPLSSAN